MEHVNPWARNVFLLNPTFKTTTHQNNGNKDVAFTTNTSLYTQILHACILVPENCNVMAAHLVWDSRWPGWVWPQGWHRSEEAAPAKLPPHHETPPAAHRGQIQCQKVACESLVYVCAHTITHLTTLTVRACEQLTRLCRISSLANSNEQEEMSIRFFNSA